MYIYIYQCMYMCVCVCVCVCVSDISDYIYIQIYAVDNKRNALSPYFLVKRWVL